MSETPPPNTPQPSRAERAWMYETMVKSRRFEDRISEIYMQGKTPVFDVSAGLLTGELHTSQGQEPVAVGVCAAMLAEDCITATHRPHHIAIARGVDLDRMSAEIFGRAAGLCGGRGGHMHLYDRAVGFSCSGIIAEGLGPAAGMAFAKKMRKEPGIVVAVIGDGAANQGAFHEVMNLVGIYKLPLVCVIEDNGWAVTIPKSASTAIARNSDRAVAYGLPGEYVEGNDPDAIYAAAMRAVGRARAGEGGSIIEVQTTRLMGHFIPDPQGYRDADELAGLVDILPVYRARLRADADFTEGELADLEARAWRVADAAVAFALASPTPDSATAGDCVFA